MIGAEGDRRPLGGYEYGRNMKRMDEPCRAIEEVSGEIRFGSVSSISIEERLKTADDAQVLEAPGNWLPGII